MDEGLYNILKWGYISLDGEDFDETNYDYCDGDSLNEYYCDGDQPTPLEILCEHGCISPTGQYDYLGKCAEPEETYQCGDGIDNDGDGLIDLDDPECLTPEDNDESDEEEETEEPEEIAICTKVEIEILAQNIEDSTVINMDAGLYDTQKWGYISLNEEGYTQDSSSDHCHGNSLNEYYCDGNQPILLATSCEYGCVSEEQYGYNFGKCAGGEEPEEEESEEEEEEETYRCNDGYDNDNDGKVDLDDPGCTTPTDDDERNDCGDGYDNDNDGYTDLEELFVCEDKSGLYEGESQKAAGNLINAILKILGVSQ